MIEKIKFENFKNKAGTQKLTGFDLFIGANGTGKSSVIEAVELALLGKIKNRQTPRDIFRLSSNDSEMSVEISIDKGGEEYSVKRRFKKKEKADGTKAFSQSLNVNFSDATSIKEQEEDMNKVFGTLPVSFDFNSFSSLSNREKKDFVLSFSSVRPVQTEEEFRDFMESSVLGMVPANIDRPILQDVTNKMVEHVVDLSGKDDIHVLETLDILLEESKDRISYLRKDMDRCLKSQQKLTDKRNDMGIAPVKISFDEKVLEKKREMLSEAISTLKNLEYTKSLLSKELEKKRKLMDEIDYVNSKSAVDKEPFERKIESSQKELKELNDKYALLEVEKTSVIESIDEVKKILQSKRDVFMEFKEEGVKLKEKINNENDLLSKVKATGGRCVINSTIPCHEDFGGWITAKESNILIMNKGLDEKRTALEKIREEMVAAEKEYESLHEKHRAMGAESNMIVTKSSQLNREISELVKKLEELVGFDKVKGEKLSNLSTNLNECIKTIDAFQDEVKKLEESAPAEKADTLREEIKLLSETLEKKKESALLTTQIEESVKEYDITAKSLEAMKYIQSVILSSKTAIFERLLAPVTKTINENLKNMNYHEFFAEMEDQEFVFGLKKTSGEKVPFEALSTGQQAVLSVCMVASFIENSDTKLKVFAIDNVENIDYLNFEKVVTGLSKIRPKFDNIILSGCLTEIPMIPSLELWSL